MLTEQLLDRLAATWRAHGAPIEDALAPGRTVESFTSDDGTLHVDLPEELRTWWAWHDGGIKEGDSGSVFSRQMGPLRQPMSSTWSREWWQTMMAEAAQMAASAPEGAPPGDPDYWWREGWVPLFSDGAGYLVADCQLDLAGATPIRRIEWGPELDQTIDPLTDSLGQLVEWMIEAIEHAIWTYDQDRGRWVKARSEPEIEQRYNGLI
jgi:cell wall assembly regulator SMI1